jgi:hypothetical protein
MPTETGTAFLIDPMGHAPVVLDGSEFEKIKNYLDIMRNENASALSSAISWLFYLANKSTEPEATMDNRAIVGHMVHHFFSDIDGGESGGILADRFGADIEVISGREAEVLRSTLATLRAGGWFPAWIAMQTGIRADASQHPDDRFASPLRVAGSLVDAITEFEASLETARDFARMRPDLLFPTPAEPQATPEPPAAEETSERSRKGTSRMSYSFSPGPVVAWTRKGHCARAARIRTAAMPIRMSPYSSSGTARLLSRLACAVVACCSLPRGLSHFRRRGRLLRCDWLKSSP